MNVVVEASAYADVDELADFYASQDASVGEYFVQRFISSIRELEQTGGTHSKRRSFHFCLVRRFPVAIFYKIESGEVRIRAVIHCHRNPRWIRQQLKSR